MMHLITGGSGSGKSAYAEQLVMEYKADRRIYIATMMVFDEEDRKRVERHRVMRREKQFETIECPYHLAELVIPEGSTVLLECVSNLAANEMYAIAGADTVAAVLRGIRNLKRQASHMVIVTNEVFSDGCTYDVSTMQYLEYLGAINCALAKEAEHVTEVVYGIPVELK